jgi:hypothetical protein
MMQNNEHSKRSERCSERAPAKGLPQPPHRSALCSTQRKRGFGFELRQYQRDLLAALSASRKMAHHERPLSFCQRLLKKSREQIGVWVLRFRTLRY